MYPETAYLLNHLASSGFPGKDANHLVILLSVKIKLLLLCFELFNTQFPRIERKDNIVIGDTDIMEHAGIRGNYPDLLNNFAGHQRPYSIYHKFHNPLLHSLRLSFFRSSHQYPGELKTVASDESRESSPCPWSPVL